MPKFLVIHTDPDLHPLSNTLKSSLEQAGAETMLFRSSPDHFAAAAGDAHAILNADFKLTAALIASLRQCRVISRFGTGVDNIDVGAATARGIPIANVPEFCTEEVANRAWTLLLACASQLLHQDRAVRGGLWREPGGVNTLPIEGQTLGLVGFGKVARAVARRARAFGMKVQAHDPFLGSAEIEAEGAGPADLETLLSTSDIISLHVPLTPETAHLIDRKALSMMKPTAVLINTARGGLIDEAVLLEHLRGGLMAGAGLDVLESEPPARDHPLLANERVILTPHSAAFSSAALERVRKSAVDAVVRVLTGQQPLHVVNPSVLGG
jgi:D-3-phosphoglycerate dehydrogenase